MDGSQRRKPGEDAPIAGSRNSTDNTRHPPSSVRTKSIWHAILYILRQILELPTTAILLGYGFIVPELKDTVTSIGMGKTFNPATDIGSLEGKVILVTGGMQLSPSHPIPSHTTHITHILLTPTPTGNAGLGKQTILYLSSHNPARIYLAARTPSKATAAIQAIKSAVPTACEIIHLPLDLSSFSSIAAAADTFRARETRLDILINNAGIMASPYSLTKEGYEIQFGTNHMGHALLIKLLLPTMLATARQGADVRIVTLSSMGHHLAAPGGIIFDQAALEKQNTWRRYGASKLANILYTRSLAEQYPQLTCVSLHPGVILTDLFQNLRTNVFLKIGIWLYGLLGMILPGHYSSAEGGALNQTWAATVDKAELVSGAFYKPVGVKNDGSKWARDQGLQKKLWEWTESELERHGY